MAPTHGACFQSPIIIQILPPQQLTYTGCINDQSRRLNIADVTGTTSYDVTGTTSYDVTGTTSYDVKGTTSDDVIKTTSNDAQKMTSNDVTIFASSDAVTQQDYGLQSFSIQSQNIIYGNQTQDSQSSITQAAKQPILEIFGWADSNRFKQSISPIAGIF